MIRYGLGQEDKFRGTGVFSFIEFDRKKAADQDDERSNSPTALPVSNKKSSSKASVDADDA